MNFICVIFVINIKYLMLFMLIEKVVLKYFLFLVFFIVVL